MDKIKFPFLFFILISTLIGFFSGSLIINPNSAMRLINESYSQLKSKFSKSNPPAHEKKQSSERFKKNLSLKKEYQNQKNIEQAIDNECRSMIENEITYTDSFYSTGLTIRENDFTVYRLKKDSSTGKFRSCKNIGTFEFNKVYRKDDWLIEFSKFLVQCDDAPYHCDPIGINAYGKNLKVYPSHVENKLKKDWVFRAGARGENDSLLYNNYFGYDTGSNIDIFNLP